MTSRSIALLFIATLLCACSKPESASPSMDKSSKAPVLTSENQGILTNAQRDAFNKANNVSDMLEKAEAERRKQMEAQGI